MFIPRRCSVCVKCFDCMRQALRKIQFGLFEHETNGICTLGLPAPESAWAEERESPKSASETSVWFLPNGSRWEESLLKTGN